MSLLRFWALNMEVALLSMQGQKALGFNQKYIFVPKMNEGLSGLERRVINDRTFILVWAILCEL